MAGADVTFRISPYGCSMAVRPIVLYPDPVLLEPTSVIEKGIIQAYEIQRRLKIWRPQKAAVLGAGTIGLLAALSLRMRGLEVTSFGRTEPPYLNSELLAEIGIRYVSTKQTSLSAGSARECRSIRRSQSSSRSLLWQEDRPASTTR